MTVHPWFKQGLIHLPEECKKDIFLTELLNELSLATHKGFKSSADDAIDCVAMLSVMKAFKPSEEVSLVQDETGVWSEMEESDYSARDSYVV
jgi:hypothetical protein